MTTSADTRRVESVELIHEDGNRATYQVVIDCGENYGPSISPSTGPNYIDKLKVADGLTKQRILYPGDMVTEPGINGSETRKGIVLQHHVDSQKVAYTDEDGAPRITERHRVVREASA